MKEVKGVYWKGLEGEGHGAPVDPMRVLTSFLRRKPDDPCLLFRCSKSSGMGR